MVARVGAIYGNLRVENIVIKIDKTKKTILSTKFLNFGCLIKIEDVDKIRIPDRIDHLPPDMISWLVNI